ncbi:MAG TPA: hypothetical protein VJ258_03475 [Candidatus Limnocylindrales bacterium]|jgi:hypothetical protein|nr:hypothetical protein [Candidatus Limnocylindrales bacterium]
MPFGLGGKGPAAAVDADAIVARFLAALPPDHGAIRAGAGLWKAADTKQLLGQDDRVFTALLRVVQTSHGGGILRFFLPATKPSLVEWNGQYGWHGSWPSKPNSIAIASDWLGNLILLDPNRARSGQRRVALLDLATGAYDLCGDLAEFVDSLPDNWERLLFKRRFDKYLAAGGKRPNITECVDYAIAPLVGGGKENLRKMKVSGLEDAVSRAGHQRDKYGAIPPGLRPPG